MDVSSDIGITIWRMSQHSNCRSFRPADLVRCSNNAVTSPVVLTHTTRNLFDFRPSGPHRSRLREPVRLCTGIWSHVHWWKSMIRACWSSAFHKIFSGCRSWWQISREQISFTDWEIASWLVLSRVILLILLPPQPIRSIWWILPAQCRK
jgi:hypothetical protein